MPPAEMSLTLRDRYVAHRTNSCCATMADARHVIDHFIDDDWLKNLEVEAPTCIALLFLPFDWILDLLGLKLPKCPVLIQDSPSYINSHAAPAT